jgi:hypothetical protein
MLQLIITDAPITTFINKTIISTFSLKLAIASYNFSNYFAFESKLNFIRRKVILLDHYERNRSPRLKQYKNENLRVEGKRKRRRRGIEWLRYMLGNPKSR